MLDRFALVNSMFCRVPVRINENTVILVNEIMAEDGSGHNFIVTGQRIGFSNTVRFFISFKTGRITPLKCTA